MPWFRWRAALRERLAARPGRGRSRPGCECLEGRALLSGVSSFLGGGKSTSLSSYLFPKPPDRNPVTVKVVFPDGMDGRTNALMELSKTDAPLRQKIQGSKVLKVPRFPLAYNGPKQLDLNVIGSTAAIRRDQGFSLTGRLLGPTTASDEAVYSFLINRGGATALGPAGGARSVRYDAVVQVTKGTAGVTAVRVDLVGPSGRVLSSTALPTALASLSGDSVSVSVPAGLLPSTSASGTPRYSYSFLAATPGGRKTDIAGYSPERTMTIISGAAPGGAPTS
ncbi:hypothetical protein OJF2_70830 [Aquisphaera giovannonii]|uniref:Uncharacterized protein n=1 Tax=Aquisphaera giovannonii TaxID=406548 RepID=A0A5B9WF29_9BACT|nr:hypothetical protein [Aquisphaera giovannonii]QEH38480.1 hypothetical protein OJF2_70830 [Aquisphaera giovannonii]